MLRSWWRNNHHFDALGQDICCCLTPIKKPLRQTLPQGNIKGLTKPFYRGTNTEEDILPEGIDLVVVLFG